MYTIVEVVENMDAKKENKTKVIDHWDWALGAILFTAVMVLYIRTLAPSLLLGDSAEFQALAYTLGLAHATGYPVYIVLAKLATFIPIGDVAYRVNLFSAILAGLALVQVYWIGRLLGSGRIAALIGPAALAVCQVFWWQAVIAEVYTAAAAFLAGVVLLVLLWRRSGNAWCLFWAGVLGGLSLGVHTTVALAAPGVLVYLLARRAGRQAWIKAGLGALAGLILFLATFFTIDGLQTPGTFTEVVRPTSDIWSYSWEDFDSPFKRFEFIFFAAQWRRQMFISTPSEVQAQAGVYFQHMIDGFRWPVVVLVVLGSFAFFVYPSKQRWASWQEGLFLLASWAGLFIYIINYTIHDINTFYIPTYILLMPVVGVGLTLVVDFVHGWLGARKPGHLGTLASGVLSLLVFFIALLPAWKDVSSAWEAGRITFLDGTDQAWYPYPVNDPMAPLMTARAIVDDLDDGAIIFTTWDKLYGVLYVASVERNRSDVIMHELYPFSSDNKVSPQTLDYIARNIAERPIYITFEDPVLSQIYRLRLVDIRLGLFQLEMR